MEIYDIPLAVLAVLIVFSNFTVCVLVYRTRSLRTYSNGFVVSLAISDVLTGGVFFPAYFAKVSYSGYIVSTVLLADVANLCFVTLDRYIAVVRPLRYVEIIRKYFTKIIAGGWAVLVGVSLIPVIWETDMESLAHKVYMVFHQLVVVLPHIFIFVTYYRMYRQIRKSILREKQNFRLKGTKKRFCQFSKEAKYIQVFTIVAVMFVLSWLPIVYMTAVVWFGRADLIPPGLKIISHYTLALGSLVNPILYSFKKPDFRKVIGKMLTKKRPTSLKLCNSTTTNQRTHITSMLSTKARSIKTTISHAQPTEI